MALTKTPIINEQLDTLNGLMGSLVRQKMSEATEVDLDEIAKNVRRGLAAQIYDIGDQIIVPWKDTAADVEYSMPFDIVHIGKAVLETGEEVPAMYLQSHYCTPFGVQFDANEALYTQATALAAGTYYFTIGQTWSSNLYKAGTNIQFTLANAVPANGQIVLAQGTVDAKTIDSFKVTTYESPTSTTAIETVQCSLGSSGTSLGTLSNVQNYGTNGLNHMHRCNYGYNRWSQSALRQFLNSNAAKTAWWTPQNNFDRPPAELTTKDGFMKGFGDDFLSILKPIKITTALNTVEGSAIGTTENTYDTFFLPSKRNMNLNEQLSGVEGDIWGYWYRATKGKRPADYTNGAAPITYAIENHASAQAVRLRSAARGGAYRTWYVGSSGDVYYYSNATSSYRFAPACAIC